MEFVKNTLFAHGVQEDAGSNPVAPTIFNNKPNPNGSEQDFRLYELRFRI